MIKSKEKIKLKSGSNMTASILLVLVLAVFVTLLSERHYFRWDLTSTKEHTLTERTLQVLRNVDKPVTIKAFVRRGFPESTEAEKLLSSYHYASDRISYELIDPERNPSIARGYGIKTINTFIIEGYDQSQTIKIADEEHITNGLIRLVNKKNIKIYWTSGHGERSFSGTDPESLGKLQERLSKEKNEFIQINLMTEEIPPDADLLIIAAPEKQLFEEEKKSIEEFLKKGGRVLIFLEPFMDGGLGEMIESYGIQLADDIIVDKMSRVMGGDYLLPMIANYGHHTITEDFELTSLFSVARSIEKAKKDIPGISTTPLAFTSPQSWSETDKPSIDAGKVQLNEKDRKGPISLAVISETEHNPDVNAEPDNNEKREKTQPVKKGMLLVFGDVDFASNRFIDLVGNSDFVTNAINYLIGRGEYITIRKDRKPVEPLSLSRTQGQVLFWIPVIAMPLLVLLLGVIVWLRRKSL